MPDPTINPDPTPAPAGETKIEPSPAPAADPPEATPAAEKTFTQAQVDIAVKKAQKDATKAADDAVAKAKLSAEEQLKSENATLKRQIQMSSAEAAVVAALEKAGAKSAKLLFSVKKDELEFDVNGKLTNLDDILTDLKTDYSDMFGIEKPGESIDAGSGQKAGDATVLTKAKIDAMSVKEIADNMEAIDKFLATQK